MTTTKIEWATHSWNVMAGCSNVSKGCKNCYAITMTQRLGRIATTVEKYSGLVIQSNRRAEWSGDIRLFPETFDECLHWRKPRRVFVNSMSDTFHESVKFEDLLPLFNCIKDATHHRFLILTKRPHRMAAFLRWLDSHARWELAASAHLNHCWFGTSIEDEETRQQRMPPLVEMSACYRIWASFEPLLGAIDMSDPLDLEWLGWMVVGGESGGLARPCNPDHVANLYDLATDTRTPFFFKQWGLYWPATTDNQNSPPDDAPAHLDVSGADRLMLPRDTNRYYRLGKSRSGRRFRRREWSQLPLHLCLTDEEIQESHDG